MPGLSDKMAQLKKPFKKLFSKKKPAADANGDAPGTANDDNKPNGEEKPAETTNGHAEDASAPTAPTTDAAPAEKTGAPATTNGESAPNGDDAKPDEDAKPAE